MSDEAYAKVRQEGAWACRFEMPWDFRLTRSSGAALAQRQSTAAHGDISVAVKALRAGAVNFIEKPYEKEVLFAAIDEAYSKLDRVCDREIKGDEARMRLSSLTGCERDVLDGLAAGFPNKTIAYDLSISPRTVEIYRANMMEKLRVKILSEALRIAFAAEDQADGVRQIKT